MFQWFQSIFSVISGYLDSLWDGIKTLFRIVPMASLYWKSVGYYFPSILQIIMLAIGSILIFAFVVKVVSTIIKMFV